MFTRPPRCWASPSRAGSGRPGRLRVLLCGSALAARALDLRGPGRAPPSDSRRRRPPCRRPAARPAASRIPRPRGRRGSRHSTWPEVGLAGQGDLFHGRGFAQLGMHPGVFLDHPGAERLQMRVGRLRAPSSADQLGEHALAAAACANIESLTAILAAVAWARAFGVRKATARPRGSELQIVGASLLGRSIRPSVSSRWAQRCRRRRVPTSTGARHFEPEVANPRHCSSPERPFVGNSDPRDATKAGPGRIPGRPSWSNAARGDRSGEVAESAGSNT